MKKRSILLGDYDTAAHGLWTLKALSFPEPAPMENLVQIPGRLRGPLDLSTALTDGVPTYGPRQLVITLESSEGDRLARQARISDMVNRLHGRRVDIVLPDHPMHYATGRLAVKTLYNDLAHASVEVSGVCEPWLYALEETQVRLRSTEVMKSVRLRNAGAMPVVPVVDVVAEKSSFPVVLLYDDTRYAMDTGTYVWPGLRLAPGDHVISYRGAGTVAITYREAVLI